MNSTTRKTALRICIVLLALLAVPRVVYESHRLLFGQSYWDASDIRNFHNLTTLWRSGQDLYATQKFADYPPASYPLMLPMYLLDNDLNRSVWFAHAVIVLSLFIWMCVRESGADSMDERICVALLPLAMFSTGVVIGNGQLVIHALTASTAAILLLYNSRGRISFELAAAACMTFALVKPSLTAPFFWIFLLVPRRKYAAVFVIVGYFLFTVLGASLQPASVADQFRGFISRGSEWTASFVGFGTVPIWLVKAGYPNLIMPFNVIALAAMGTWVWANRRVDRWLLYGGLAIMTRLWAFHQLHDDMLNLLAFIALIRLASGRSGNRQPDRAALVVLLLAMTTLPGPATPLRFWVGARGWISLVVRGWHTTVRIPMLAVIMHRAWTQRNQTQEQMIGAPLSPIQPRLLPRYQVL